MPVDKDLKCAVGKVFTIFGKRMINTPTRAWHRNEITNKLEPPLLHRLKLVRNGK